MRTERLLLGLSFGCSRPPLNRAQIAPARTSHTDEAFSAVIEVGSDAFSGVVRIALVINTSQEREVYEPVRQDPEIIAPYLVLWVR